MRKCFCRLDLSPIESAGFYRLPRLTHKDPFDRLLIWQAIQRKLILIGKDRALKAYGDLDLKTLW
jgi:PIN domain nuclease of toxin-antitoxin system